MDLNIPPSATEKIQRRTLSEGIPVTGTLSSSPSNPQMNPNVVDPSAELTEDDIFLMKGLSNKYKMNEQSAFSQVDSMSKYREQEFDGEQELDDEIDDEYPDLTNSLSALQPIVNGSDNLCPNSNSTVSYAQAVKHGKKTVLHNNYVFGRERLNSREIDLNKQTVTILHYPFEPIVTDRDEDEEDYRRAFSQAKVYIVGTAHFSMDSRQDVLNTISSTQPDFVMVELCSSRISILSMNEEELLKEASSLNREKILAIIRQSGLLQGLMHILLLSTSAHITRQLGMAPGCEFRTAHAESKKVLNCGLILGDRPLHVTLKRALSSLSFFQKLRFLYQIFLTNTTGITQEDVERCKNKDLLESLLKEMAGEFPQLTKIMIEERDLYMANVLHTLLQKYTLEKYIASKEAGVDFEPVVGVAVVGIGHVNGIESNWSRHIDSTSLLSLPQPSRSSRLIKFSVKASMWIGLGYLGYKLYKYGRRNVSPLSGITTLLLGVWANYVYYFK